MAGFKNLSLHLCVATRGHMDRSYTELGTPELIRLILTLILELARRFGVATSSAYTQPTVEFTVRSAGQGSSRLRTAFCCDFECQIRNCDKTVHTIGRRSHAS